MRGDKPMGFIDFLQLGLSHAPEPLVVCAESVRVPDFYKVSVRLLDLLLGCTVLYAEHLVIMVGSPSALGTSLWSRLEAVCCRGRGCEPASGRYALFLTEVAIGSVPAAALGSHP